MTDDQKDQKTIELSRAISLLNATIESTADGILVVDNQGKIVSFNQNFVKMWRIPREIIDSRDDNRALAFVLDQLKDPQGFLKKVKELYSRLEAESFDVLQFKDGRIFERYSKPQKIENQTVGRVWSFRDVTKSRQTEESLKEKIAEFEKTLNMMVGRELKMTSLKEEIEKLKAELAKK